MWELRYADDATDQLLRLDRPIARCIRTYLVETVASGDPRSCGRGLMGPSAGYWRYRVGDYRVIAYIEDDRLVVIAVAVGHRSEVYKEAS
ncbi:MAG: type II toxin-antitoxin system RelE/ParE family toxin [Propionibacteriaceae bacterium]|nr:type II toxin-antitoxin system RelE/ParE family toxin [Propionibacteriaceae bacterium]